jgi:alkane 1-monooxygenase
MNGGHHSDHHRTPSCGYAALTRHGQAPELPAGYAATMMSALVPPLWRRIIHPRLDRLDGVGEQA